MVVFCKITDSQGNKCGKRWRDIHALSIHQNRVHSPKECKRCPDLKLPDLAALQKHRKIHLTGNFCKRTWCMYGNPNKSTFRTHLATCRASNELIKCSRANCTKTYKTLKRYQSHLRKCHKLELEEAKRLILAEKPPDELPETNERSQDAISDDECPTPPLSPVYKRPVPKPAILKSRYDISLLANSPNRQILTYGRLKILYGKTRRGPLLAHLTMTKESLMAGIESRAKDKSTKKLIEDTNVEYGCRAFDGDYNDQPKNLHRGHLHSTLNLDGDEETRQAIPKYSITLPQLAEFNKRIWEDLEDYERFFVSQHKITESMAGAFYLEDLGTVGRLKIPSHYFKILVGTLPSGKIDIECFGMKHKVYPKGIPLQTFYKTIDELKNLDQEGIIPDITFDNINHYNAHDYSEFGKM